MDVGEVLVEAKDDRGPLTVGHVQESVVHRLVEGLVHVGHILSAPRKALEVGPLDASVAEVGGHEVHDRPAEIGAEGVSVAQVPHPADEPCKRLLDDLFGQSSVAGQQEREPDALGRAYRSLSGLPSSEPSRAAATGTPLRPSLTI
jgi:hypothetical protein